MRAVTVELRELPLVLKGGTALLLCYGLDRFSEDIDLDGRKKLNIRSRVEAALSRVTREHDIRIAKDTDTVQRLKIRYVTAVSKGALKIEVSYRNGFDDADTAVISGVKTYRVACLIEQKLAALEGRTTARDLYDVAFLVGTYPNEFSEQARRDIQRMTLDIDGLENRFRAVFEEDDLFLTVGMDVADVIVRLHDGLAALMATSTASRPP